MPKKPALSREGKLRTGMARQTARSLQGGYNNYTPLIDCQPADVDEAASHSKANEERSAILTRYLIKKLEQIAQLIPDGLSLSGLHCDPWTP